MAALNEPTRAKEPMEKELFEKMEKRLSEIFLHYNTEYDADDSEEANMATSQAALALMTLKRDFRPEG